MKYCRAFGMIGMAALWGANVIAAGPLPRAVVKTSEGEIVLELDSSAAPQAVTQFKRFVRDSVYDDSSFDQVPDGNEIQGGKPGAKCRAISASGNFSSAKGSPGEFGLKHAGGAVVFARTVGSCNPGKTCNSTQFCIYLEDKPQNEGEFTVFGRVVAGMDVARKIAARLKQEPREPVKIISVQVLD